MTEFTMDRLRENLEALKMKNTLEILDDAGAFVMLSAANLRQDAGLGTATLETLQGAVQRLVFLDMNFRHLSSLPPIHPALSWMLSRANHMA